MADNPQTVREKTFAFSLVTPHGKLPPLSVKVSYLPMRLSELVPLMQAICDKIVGQACTGLGSGEKVTCSKGCGACCRQVVPVSIPEALFLMEQMELMEPGRREITTHRLSNALTECRRDGLLDALLSAPSDQAAIGAAQEYFNRGIVCPFLEEGACSIHPARPFACREFNAVTPPKWCDDPFQNRVRRVPVVPKMTTVMARFAAKVLHERPVVLPMATIASEVTMKPSWKTEKRGIDMFSALLDCMNQQPKCR
ncbi:MAG: YkgJ family cysteine cluster protein [Chitinispirillaceae bacterium]|nr:YkgJ family cysteine cluster protein [Chitinispirillaceae bacterium]